MKVDVGCALPDMRKVLQTNPQRNGFLPVGDGCTNTELQTTKKDSLAYLHSQILFSTSLWASSMYRVLTSAEI